MYVLTAALVSLLALSAGPGTLAPSTAQEARLAPASASLALAGGGDDEGGGGGDKKGGDGGGDDGDEDYRGSLAV